jgi:hypothetical protein
MPGVLPTCPTLLPHENEADQIVNWITSSKCCFENKRNEVSSSNQ